MKVLGLTFSTNAIYVCALSGTKEQPEIEAKVKIILPLDYKTEQLAEWFETELGLILSRVKPTSVTYRLTVGNTINHKYITNVFYGQAILNLLCCKSGIKIDHTSPTSIVASKFQLAKGTDLKAFIDERLKKPSNPWDLKMRENALMTLMFLP